MSHPSRSGEPSPSQEAIRAKCFHPSGSFVEFRKEEVEQSIPDRFEKIVRMYPDRVSVQTESHVLTYAELNATANRVARAIVAQQGSESEPVGLLFEKGPPLMAAMLGVLKAGKFFVPLDPSFPRARIEAVLEDSQARLVITDRQTFSLAREAASSRCQLMEFGSIDCGMPAEDLRLSISPRAPALIFYTSGSTGQPKGVVWNHRHLLHSAMLRTNAYHICEHDRLSLLPSGTPNAVTNAFPALLAGAALLPFDVEKEGVGRLSRWLLQERISVCLISTPLFRSLCETLTGEEKFSALRVIRLMSESVYKRDVDLYKRHFSPACILANGLSSSETGPVSEYLIDHQTDIAGSEVPVGYAGEGKEILLLDDTGKELGFDEVGEIAIRSSYLSPGYWGKPDLTKAKFIPDPRGGDERIYMTGDLGLMLPDGCFVYKGRKDFRVKIRGYTVEVAEVEKALLEHAAVREAVVVARENQLGEARLVAYFTPCGTRPGVSELQRFLRPKLPDHMIPSAFVMLDRLPVKAGDKIDRRALPEPARERPELATPFIEPVTTVETELAEIWAEVLSVDRVGTRDNFFELGGHSLAAARVVSRVLKTFQLDLPLQSLFRAPTVADMAVIITENQARKVGQEEVARMLAELELLSDEQAQRLLAEEKPQVKE